VWHPSSLKDVQSEYRVLERFWLPVYDLIAMSAGITAIAFGSRILDRIFGDVTDVLGLLLIFIAAACLVSVSFEQLWKLEIAAKTALIGLIVSYMCSILLFPSPEQLASREAPNWFVVSMLAFGLPLALSRIDILLRRDFKRKVQERVNQLRNE